MTQGLVFIQVKERGATPQALKRQWPKVLKQAYLEMMVFHHRIHLPKHFRPSAFLEYQYTPRAGMPGSQEPKSFYTHTKWRELGHADPIVFSGVTRFLTQIRDTAGTTSKQGKLNIKVPIYVSNKRKDSRVNMAEELLTISRFERRTLKGVFERALDRGIKRVRTSRRRPLR